ncbi:N-acetylmuramoyl-L-alanine amidase [Clostridium sp. Sa3CUN1]|uniref:N-acetylmuramoyl-L-alanine amidase n=1 Tax=Clostridium gallinarum TaxID=2762246 RepID=A0ABR8Q4W6_9CLOT|nr:N-acetylmuramoyl-L-alanine amidase [Clostridium gallinarum]MBD7915462.1 N-acetylmuramoyl-L-alanine amidase [Clostridium gallinarum]
MNSNFDISSKRKLLYKRKRKRQLIFKIYIVLLAISILSLILLLNKSTPVNKKVISSSNSLDNKIIICIDPGHGDFDTGAKSSSGIFEKDIVLEISLKLGKLLEENDIKVIYTRTNDSLPWLETANDSLKERIRISKAFKADIFISIHCNSNYDDISAKGIETWYKPNDESSKNLALILQTSLSNLNSTIDRGIKTYDNKDDALAVLELNESISALVELGFLSNTYDEKYLNSDKGKEAFAKSIKDGLLNYIESNKDIIIKKRSNKAM